MAKSTSITVPAPRQLSSGNWFIQLRLGGESVPVTAPNDKECIRQATLLKAEHKAGKRIVAQSKANPTLRQAIDDYIAARSNTLSPSTIKGYEIIRNNRFQSTMTKHIKDVKNWQLIINDEAKTCCPKTLKNAWGLVSTVVRGAGYTIPSVTLPQVPQNEHRFLEPEQVKVFVEAIKGDDCEIPALLALQSLRRSEIMALKWENIDFQHKRILVSGAVVQDKNNKLVEKRTNKNRSSHRYVPIMIDGLYNALETVENKEGNVVLCHPNTIWHHINLCCKANGLPEVGIHGLRHSFASLAYSLGASEKITMQIGGWSDYDTMRKIYTHLAQADLASTETIITNFFKNANENANELKKDSIINAYTVD